MATQSINSDLISGYVPLCYTSSMQPPSYWENWAEKLERWGLRDLAATLLESSGPVSTILAQLVYAGSPLIPILKTDVWMSLAHLFENPVESHLFVKFLREGNPK
jgi:hypothetical protein